MAKSAIMHCSDWIRIGSTTTCGDEFVTNTTALCRSVLFLGVMIPWRCIQLYIYWGQLCLFACSNVVLDLICLILLHYVIQGLFKNWRYCFHCSLIHVFFYIYLQENTSVCLCRCQKWSLTSMPLQLIWQRHSRSHLVFMSLYCCEWCEARLQWMKIWCQNCTWGLNQNITLSVMS